MVDACVNCWHRDFQHGGTCVGAGLSLRWSRFLQPNCLCERFISARVELEYAKIQIKQLRVEVDAAFDEGYKAALESVSEWLKALEK